MFALFTTSPPSGELTLLLHTQTADLVTSVTNYCYSSCCSSCWGDTLRTLHSQAVVEAKTNFVPNRVLGALPPNISPLESLLPRSVRTTLA